MNKINSIFKNIKDNRSLSFLLFAFVGLFMLIVDIAYICIDGGALKITDYSTTLAFIFVLIGSILSFVFLFTNNKYIDLIAPLLICLCFGIGVGRQVYLCAYPFADLITGVNWFGGNLTIYLTFTILFLIGLITDIVLSFTNLKKSN